MENQQVVPEEKLENAGDVTSQEQEGEELVPPLSATALIQSVSQIASQTANSVRETVVSARESVASVKHSVVVAKDSVLRPPQENESLTHDPSANALRLCQHMRREPRRRSLYTHWSMISEPSYSTWRDA